MTTLIEVSGLRKLYRSSFRKPKIIALDGIDFQVKEGELFGLLGPNGAGKTTTVKILLGLTHATAGSASVCGLPVRNPESRRRVGYLPEGHKIPNYLTARQALSIFGRMSGMSSADIAKRIPHLLDQVRMTQWADVRIKKFSKGMTQRLGLACAMVHSPQVLLLDEPTDGVDPVGRREIRDILRAEADRGVAVLLNSHLLSEIERTCDRVAVLRDGKVAAFGTVKDLTQKSATYKMVASPIDDSLVASFRETGAGVERVNGHMVLSVTDVPHLNALVDQLRARGGMLNELTPVRETLEDVFVDLVRAEEGVSVGAHS
ncbi:MAG TPA: ABC transporter ATP-binding protein [Thermoanaerobaculia bacterium]|jgi:ABC-2 type transport system ATP-binding protein|nr:ABC transporter ATP-binding protein [Thermoanaerobaculia bacterium]